MTTTTLDHAPAAARARTGDPTRSAHIVDVPPELREAFPSPQAYVLAARVNGTPVTALCGYTWVPSQDPEALPVCPRCLEIYQWRLTPDQNPDELPEA